MNRNYMIKYSPSELDYAAKKCQRCFYLKKINNIELNDFPPPVFSSFDVVQQAYFKNYTTKDLTDQLPTGHFMKKDELPGLIISKELHDLKDRSFILGGRPDIVIKFEEEGYGIIDFKTTNISPTKSDNYKFQLEAYAQIFTYPGSTKTKRTPKLNPITHMGILQFYPTEIFDHHTEECELKMKMSYSPLERNIDEFYEHITKLNDLLYSELLPEFNSECNKCNFVENQNKI